MVTWCTYPEYCPGADGFVVVLHGEVGELEGRESGADVARHGEYVDAILNEDRRRTGSNNHDNSVTR